MREECIFHRAIWTYIEAGSIWTALGCAVLALIVLQVGYAGPVVCLIYWRSRKRLTRLVEFRSRLKRTSTASDTPRPSRHGHNLFLTGLCKPNAGLPDLCRHNNCLAFVLFGRANREPFGDVAVYKQIPHAAPAAIKPRAKRGNLNVEEYRRFGGWRSFAYKSGLNAVALGSSFASQCRQQVGLQRVCGDRHLPRASG